MNLPDKLLRIAASRWTARICFVLILFAAQSRDARLWWIAGAAAAWVAGTLIASSIGPLRAARRAGRDFPHTPEYEAYIRNSRPDDAVPDSHCTRPDWPERRCAARAAHRAPRSTGHAAAEMRRRYVKI